MGVQAMLVWLCRPQEIDEAARRRLVKRLYIPLPDGSARKQIVTNLLREQAYSLTQEELEELSTASEGDLTLTVVCVSLYGHLSLSLKDILVQMWPTCVVRRPMGQ